MKVTPSLAAIVFRRFGATYCAVQHGCSTELEVPDDQPIHEHVA
jgi:hypothetical protein